MMRRLQSTVALVLCTLTLAGGCATTPAVSDERARERMLTLLLPSRIEIVEPFTRIASFDADSTPDGIELLLQAVNSYGNPGLMIAGNLRIELYEYVPASGAPRGTRHAQWNVELAHERQQRTFWNQLTQMYEFRLAVENESIPPADKYVVLVIYENPMGERLTDEFILGKRQGAESQGRAPRAPPAPARAQSHHGKRPELPGATGQPVAEV